MSKSLDLHKKMLEVDMPNRLQVFMWYFYLSNPNRDEEFDRYVYLCDHWKDLLALDYIVFDKKSICENEFCDKECTQAIKLMVPNINFEHEFSFCEYHMKNLIENLNNYAGL